MEVNIYCLADPITCRIRYIGRTSKKNINHRLIEHLTEARYFERYFKDRKLTHKANWIRSLLDKNLEPKIKLLTRVTGWKESHEMERFLIKKYRKKFNLVNSDDRGEGCKNRNISKEERDKISSSLRRYYNGGSSKTSKKIDVFNLSGEKIGTYESIRKFSVDKDIKYSKALAQFNGKFRQYKGYRLQLHSEKNNIDSFVRKKDGTKQSKIVKVTNLKTKEENIFVGIKKCSENLGYSQTTIRKMIRNKSIFKDLRFELVQYKSDKLLETPEEDNQQPI